MFSYTVVLGEAVTKIAEKFCMKAYEQVQEVNPQINDINHILPGQVINIPGRVYTVLSGDLTGNKLSFIAKKFDIQPEPLRLANRQINFDLLKAGWRIYVPGNATWTYTVVAGDTSIKIAEKFDITLKELQKANPTQTLDTIQPGQKLKIPAK